jgi:VWFA-related protein
VELADQSAFLDPPASERLGQTPPTIAEQRDIMERATTYTVGYAKNLPNLISTETIHRFDDSNPDSSSKALGDFHLRDTVVAQVTFLNGDEKLELKPVAGRRMKSNAISGLTSSGEFGNMMISVFLPTSHARAKWSHWEVLHGQRVAVFRYLVVSGNSTYQVDYCCVNKQKVSLKTAYQGFLFVDPRTGTIARMTRSTIGLPDDFPMRQLETAVEYGPVTIGEQSYMCPLRSVTRADSIPADGSGEGKNLIARGGGIGGGGGRRGGSVHTVIDPGEASGNGGRLHSLNETTFSEYRKFGAESRVLLAGESAAPSAPAGNSPVQNALAAEESPDLDEEVENPRDADTHTASLFSLPQPPPFGNQQAEMDTSFATHATFRQRVSIVTVPVVVRDHAGQTITGLSKENFELADNGKRQTISSFEEQRSPDKSTLVQTVAGKPGSPAASSGIHATVLPDRYIAYLFDDLHLAFADLSQTRSAGERVLQDLLQPGARVAILTTSAKVQTDFTTDREKILATLNRLRPNPMSNAHSTCPEVGYYQADRILNFNDADALAVAVAEAVAKCGVSPNDPSTATSMAKIAARQILSIRDFQVRAALDVLRVIARRMAVLPGAREIVLVSPGFYTSLALPGMEEVEDRAVRSGVVINTLDARGLYTPAGYDVDIAPEQTANAAVAHGPQMARATMSKRDYETQEQRTQGDSLLELAYATGGRSFHNSNDFDAGFRRLAERPDVVYLLGFSPQEGKADGAYHHLKVTVKGRKGVEVQARHGYIAPKDTGDPAKQAKQEIENALLSRDEMREIPVTVNESPGVAPNAISLLTHVDIKSLSFKKAAGLNHENLRVVFGFFDSDGVMTGLLEQEFPLDFNDGDLTARLTSGVDLRSNLQAKPGSRFLRMIVRDDAGQMSTVNQQLGL